MRPELEGLSAAAQCARSRLSALHDLVGRVERKGISPGDGAQRIEGILARTPRYGPVLGVAAFGLLSTSASILLVGSGLAGLVGLAVGFPALRIKGVYLIILTMGFGEIVRVFFLNFEPTGAASGLGGIPGGALPRLAPVHLRHPHADP
jgi:hypothetical protein